MATLKGFEDLQAWQRARELVNEIYAISNQKKFGRDLALRDQIRRASVSAMSNIAEGFEQDGAAEFVQFLSHAKGSLGEVRSQLYVAKDQGYLTSKDFDHQMKLTDETSRLIGGLMIYLRKSGIKGNKLKVF